MPTYTVKPGDSSFSIAGKTLDSQRAFQFLMDSNPQIDWANLKPGQTVNIPDINEFSGVVTESSLDNIREINIANKIGGATGDDFGQGTSTGNFDDIFGVPGVNDGMINPYLLGQTPQQAPGLESEQADARTSSAIRRNLDDASRRSGALNGASPWTNRSLTSGGDTGVPEQQLSGQSFFNDISNTIQSQGVGQMIADVIPNLLNIGNQPQSTSSPSPYNVQGIQGSSSSLPGADTSFQTAQSVAFNPVNDLSATEQAEAQRNAYMTADNSVPLTRGFIEANGISDLQMIQNGYVKTAWGWQIDPIAQGIIQDAEAANGEQPISGTNYNTTPLTYYTGSVLGLGGGGGYSRPQSVSNPVADFTSGRGALINWRTGGF